ncbi:hypothetical protein CAOG_05956 [Capsaspora owczarzaki ATCC 30864]|uniref:Calponin-homology (CH) domain-containing protein n=1 Tax=Capsaspora owczarzaki (strain ATCC 30864) TaxID=595528 RepID=A0A0D2VVJ5_CAPO3|nr:hypothetical protein CAOG_05956 [Capsaspora owczarzaki ATCC 30864]KJE95507.1 hypothetical protein CAOG_005956 [Capsaspora owczarzaki ATCC 30864]|eukprot:XP_004345546.1 hypothetical protein CAOG_05956 [Capsaspora owczarzaki ATCC 30864]
MSWQDIQVRVFTAWVNEQLKERGMRVGDKEPLHKEMIDGIALINLLEIISAKKLPRYNKHPRSPYQKLENQKIALDFIASEGLKLVNIGAEDLADGSLKLTLGLIWTLILRYQVQRGSGDDSLSAKSELLKWVQSKIPEYNITGFTKDWNNGKALCALTNAVAEGSFPNHASLDPTKGADNNRDGMNKANEVLHIPLIMNPEDLAHPKVDEQSVMTYISYFWRATPIAKPNQANQCSAYGRGLVEGIVSEPAEFTVETPSKDCGKLEVKVFGPANAPQNVQVTPVPNDPSRYNVVYNPTEPGDYEVHVTLDGVHIPGSIFHVTVLEQVSLGGEGKIRVYFSTTSSTDKGRKDVIELQKLLETKKIHERPDFEPWYPIDIWTQADRNAVFKRAGTRNLPIVFIDDEYAGDADRMYELEASGKLNQLLKYNENKNKK